MAFGRNLHHRKTSNNSSPSHTNRHIFSSIFKDKDGERVGMDVGTLLRRFWKVAAPYWNSEDKTQARLRLGLVFAMTLGTTGISVLFNFLERDFYNALAKKNQEQFYKQIVYYLGAFAVGVPFVVLKDYATETLSLRWRSWMTSNYMKLYFRNRKFYDIQSQSILDNPDQRIVDDLNSFTKTALSFSLTLFNAVVDFISFSTILYGIYPALFVVLIFYSLGGIVISFLLGKGLVSLNFEQEKKEADFRYGLIRIRENAESIAFYGGEENELQLLLERFRRAFENLSKLLIASRNLDFFKNSYRYLIQIVPAAVVAPMYLSGKIEFGVINQSVLAFNHILRDFSLVVYKFQEISAFSAVINRLGEFNDILDDNQSNMRIYDYGEKIKVHLRDSSIAPSLISGSLPQQGPHRLLEVQNLTLETPSTRNILITDLFLEINDKENLLVVGPSGSGKTSFLRALAGLWNNGKGDIKFFSGSIGPNDNHKANGLLSTQLKRPKDVLFLPQRPYMVLGTLREQLLYPKWHDELFFNSNVPRTNDSLPLLSELLNTTQEFYLPDDNDLKEVLKHVNLDHLLSRFGGLDSKCDWSSVLSLGEQQRLAFARLLISKPKLVLLDESTSALDEANEANLYDQMKAAGITYISIGHRNSLYKYHKNVLHIWTYDPDDSTAKPNWRIQTIDHAAIPEANPQQTAL